MKTDVKVGNVTIPVYHCEDGTFLVKWKKEGKWKSTRRSTLVEAEKQAKEVARSILKPTMGLDGLSLEEYEVLSRARRLAITHAQLDQWEAAAKRQKKSLDAAIREYIEALLRKRGGREGAYVRPLRVDLQAFAKWIGSIAMHEITRGHLAGWLEEKQDKGIGPRRLKNLYSAVRSFMRWSEKMGFVDKATDIAGHDLVPTVPKQSVEIYTPDEMKTLLRAIASDADALLWTVFCAFSGARSNEVMPEERCEKPGLQWEHVRWDEGVIVVPAEVAKTGMRRIMPILPALEAWAKPLARSGGPIAVGDNRRVAERVNAALRAQNAAFTLRKNAARHSYGSYRTADVKSAGQVALEMGNSENVVKRHYLYHVSATDSKIWWESSPEEETLEQET